MDLAKLEGKHYLVLADRYSGWPKVAQLTHLDTHAIVKVLERILRLLASPKGLELTEARSSEEIL